VWTEICCQVQQLDKVMEQEVDQLASKIKQHRLAMTSAWAPMPRQHHKLLLPQVPLLAVAKSNPDFSSTTTMISGTTDYQSVACAEVLFCNPD